MCTVVEATVRDVCIVASLPDLTGDAMVQQVSAQVSFIGMLADCHVKVAGECQQRRTQEQQCLAGYPCPPLGPGYRYDTPSCSDRACM